MLVDLYDLSSAIRTCKSVQQNWESGFLFQYFAGKRGILSSFCRCPGFKLVYLSFEFPNEYNYMFDLGIQGGQECSTPACTTDVSLELCCYQ